MGPAGQRFSGARLACGVAALWTGMAIAQSPALDRVAEALHDRALERDTADAHYVRGLQATMDPVARIGAYARALELDSSRLLFLSALAQSCMARGAAPLASCASADPVSRWAARDADNAAPWVLLAHRARERGDLPAMRANLVHAAERPRFDGYRARGADVVAQLIASSSDLARRPESPYAAASLSASATDAALTEVSALCRRDAPGVLPDAGVACTRLARTMAERADTYAGRQAGLAIEGSWAASDPDRSRVAAARERLSASALACHAARGSLVARLEGSASERERSREIGAAAVADASSMDAVAVCERLVSRAKAANLL